MPIWAGVIPVQLQPQLAQVAEPRAAGLEVPELGDFAQDDVAAKAALKRACPKKPEAVVVPANPGQTAKNLVCARVWGAAAEAVSAELTEKHAALCGEAATCPLATTLESWAKATPPITLESDKVSAAKP